jgi:GAF domain-containing protein
MNDSNRTQLIDNIRIAVTGQTDETALLRTTAELIDGFSEHFNWTGFYLLHKGVLEVGPYIGPETEHTRIELNQGVCGAAASQKKTIIVDNVQADPRFLACSVSTRSEIVVPLMDGDKCLGEIDIDSNQPSYFNGEDRRMLEAIAAIIVTRLKEIR